MPDPNTVVQEADEEYSAIDVIDLESGRPHHLVLLGRQGENGTQDVVFDCSAWEGKISNPTFAIVAQRPGERETYLVGDVTVSGWTVTWVISSEDTAYAGRGYAEIRAASGELVKKSAKFITSIEQSVEDYGEGSSATPPYWGTEILNGVQSAQQAATAAQAAAETARAEATAVLSGTTLILGEV